MVLLENDAFLTELTKLFAGTKDVGSVFITFKRYEEKIKKEKDDKKGSSKPVTHQPSGELHQEGKCLVRATDGKHTKFSTLVSSKEIIRFQMAYANILKSQMDNLKRKEKKKKRRKL